MHPNAGVRLFACYLCCDTVANKQSIADRHRSATLHKYSQYDPVTVNAHRSDSIQVICTVHTD